MVIAHLFNVLSFDLRRTDGKLYDGVVHEQQLRIAILDRASHASD
jgi:hypothetical protein